MCIPHVAVRLQCNINDSQAHMHTKLLRQLEYSTSIFSLDCRHPLLSEQFKAKAFTPRPFPLCSACPSPNPPFLPRGLCAAPWWTRSDCRSPARDGWNTSLSPRSWWRRMQWSTCTPTTTDDSQERTWAAALGWLLCSPDNVFPAGQEPREQHFRGSAGAQGQWHRRDHQIHH